MLKKIAILCLLTSHFQGLAQKDKTVHFPPLSILLQAPSQEPVTLPDPETYLQSLGKDFRQSILSPKEMWGIQSAKAIRAKKHERLNAFHQWYFTHLPILIFAHKKNPESSGVNIVSEWMVKEVSFLFKASTPITAQDIITLTESYNYTEPEKLNLFLTLLYKNISDEELLKILMEWRIRGNQAIHIQDYERYFDNFFQLYGLENKSERQHVFSILKAWTKPLTSLLHEAFSANRLSLFKEILFFTHDNIPNYLGHTIAHRVAMVEWTKASSYFYMVFRHNFTDWTLRDFRGWTPIFYAVFSSPDSFFPVIDALVGQKSVQSDMDIVDEDRRSLPLVAMELNKPRIAKFLHKRGAPLSHYVSLQNSFLDENYNVIRVEYKVPATLDNLVQLFSWDRRQLSWAEFQNIDIEGLDLPPQTIWKRFRYYFLLNTLLAILQLEESARHQEVLRILLEDNYKGSWTQRWMRAIYRGDKAQLRALLSSTDSYFRQQPLFYMQHDIVHPYSQQALISWNLLERGKVQNLSRDQTNMSFTTSVSSFLDEAIRANQRDSVLFFLSDGVDPTMNRPNILLRNSLITALLVGDVFLLDPTDQKEHLYIIDLLMSHPSVNRDFLSQEVIPGLTYSDIASIKGHLPALRRMYEKGVQVSLDNYLWDTRIPIKTIPLGLGFARTTEFILKQQAKQEPENPALKDQLRTCQRAFH